MYGQVKFIKVFDKQGRFVMGCIGDNQKAKELNSCFQSEIFYIEEGVAIIRLRVEKAS